MSAAFSPDWGRAWGALSIFTATTGRSGTPSAAGSPVSGMTGDGGAAVVVVDSNGAAPPGAANAVRREGDPHAAVTTASATATEPAKP